MRVAWITTGFLKDESDYDGAAFLNNLAKEISQTPGVELSIFSLYYPTGINEYKFYNAKVFLCRNQGVKSAEVPKLDKLKAFFNCLSLFKTENSLKNFDVIHAIWCGESGYIASYLSRKYSIPLIANIAGGELAEIPQIGYGSRLKFWQKKFVNRTFNRAKAIVTGSDFITNKINEYYGKNINSKVVKIPFGVDDKKFHNITTDNNKNILHHPVLINIATAVPVKSHIDLFIALKIVKEKYPNVVLRCYGRDDNNILNRIAAELKISDNIRLNDFINYEKIPDVLHDADIFVLSSLYESQNMALLEAAFCGLPVVSTNVGVSPEITPHLVKAGDSTSLAEKIMFVIGNPRVEYKDLHERYSLESSAGRFRELYNSLIIQQPSR